MNKLPGKFYFQQRQKNRLYEVVVHAVEDAAYHEGVRKRDIADKLAISPSQISRWLSGPSNWEIDSISDVLWAIGAELDFNVKRLSSPQGSNRHHVLNEASQARTSVTLSSSGSTDALTPMTPTKASPSAVAEVTVRRG